MELAELLIELHPWCAGGMARFARGGGEIDMLAARIARAATGRDRIAICGYHVRRARAAQRPFRFCGVPSRLQAACLPPPALTTAPLCAGLDGLVHRRQL